eukprot:PhF_6_TR15435/c0_g1_i1/m.23948/K07359/CAMKK2; calcium/calmodulin-dependent protein kinase kinase 2
MSVRHSERVDKTRDTKGNKIINQYRVITQIGQGAYSKVKLVQSTVDDQFYALKILNRSTLKRIGLGNDSALLKVQQEIAILKKLHHPNIIRLFEVIDDQTSNKIYLVLEFAAFGAVMSLDGYGNVIPDEYGSTRISEENTKQFMKSLTSALCYSHANGVIHRDIKPDNIMLTESGDVKLTDFGVSTLLTSEEEAVGGEVSAMLKKQLLDVQGTPLFLAPELFLASKVEIDPRLVDVWALGVTMYVFLFGILPFQGATTTELVENISHHEVRFPDDIPCSDEAKDCLQSALSKDPLKRLTMEEFRLHYWITGGMDCPMSPTRPRVAVGESDTFEVQDAVHFGSNIELNDSVVPVTFEMPKHWKKSRRSSDPTQYTKFKKDILFQMEGSSPSASPRRKRAQTTVRGK